MNASPSLTALHLDVPTFSSPTAVNYSPTSDTFVSFAFCIQDKLDLEQRCIHIINLTLLILYFFSERDIKMPRAGPSRASILGVSEKRATSLT